MRITVSHRIFVVHNASRIAIARGQELEVLLSGIQAPVQWFADNDEVLNIADNEGVKATITAAAVGTSTIEFKQRGVPQGRLVIEVFKDITDEAVGFASEVGPEEPA